MIIYHKRLRVDPPSLRGRKGDPTVFVIASVNIYDQVYVEIGGEGICLPPEEALKLGQAITLAASGQGVPASSEPSSEL